MSDYDVVMASLSTGRASGEQAEGFPVKTAPRAVKIWTFRNELTAGDGVMEAGSKLKMYSDGTGEFTCRVKTKHTHSGDTWHHWIVLKNRAGAEILRLGEWTSVRMDDDHGWYDWTVNFAWNEAFFDVIQTASAIFAC
jgi:hypothetical protein